METDFFFGKPENISSSILFKDKEDSFESVDYASQLVNNGGFITRAVTIGAILFSFSFNEPATAQISKMSLQYVKPDVTILAKLEQGIQEELQNDRDQVRQYWRHEASSLALLKEGWDGEDAKRVSTTAINNVLNMLDQDEIRLDLIQDIYANETGTVTIEWDNGNKEFAGIQVGRQRMSYYVTLKTKEILKDYEPVNDGGVSELLRNLSLL